MRTMLRAMLLAAVLMLPAVAADTVETVVVYKDPG